MSTPGNEFGHYRLVRLLGVGGMGEVHLARDLALDRDVAVKFLPAAQTEDRDARRRFIREAQAAAKLDHPNICQVFEVGETPDARAYIVMSYIEGETLAARLARGPLPVREALAMVGDIADALGAAHAQGIVHRDLKPQNVMVTRSGRPKLLDFGIAKLLAGGQALAEVSTASGTTSPGAVVGTPAYMSPEQVEGHSVDARSDLFALGAVLFECLVGRRAFAGTSTFSVAGAIVHVHPPLVSTLRPDSPAELDALCARLLAKDPADRFQTAGEVLGALRLLRPITHTSSAHDHPSGDLPARRPRWSVRARAVATAAAVLLVATAASTYQWWVQPPAPPEEAERWYRRGTDFIREGAYHSATTALDQAIRQYPGFAMAFARQAEALAELDDQKRASEQLLRMQDVLGDESRLPPDDRLRMQGVRALVLRDVPRAVAAYRTLVERRPDDAGAWVDLGRAQEAAEQRVDALASYRRALTLDPESPAAFVRLASMEAQAGRRDPAMQAFAAAERLYKAASNAEGEIEVLLRRGMFLDARGELAEARRNLERASGQAESSGAIAQSVRTRLALGSVSASEGKLTDAEAQMRSAIDDARKRELWALVADGLIDVAGLLVNQSNRQLEADERVQEAIRLATDRGAQRTGARATLQRAALALQREEPALARDLASGVREFLDTRGYRRLSLTALTIVSRAHRDLGELEAARATATEALEVSQALQDEAQLSLAFTSLAGIATAAGDLPAALDARAQAAALNRRIGDEEALPFDLTNRAELLIRLGRAGDAEPLLVEVEAGIARGVESFVGRSKRVGYLRAMAAVIRGDVAAAARHATAVLDAARAPEATTTLAAALLGYALASQGRPPAALPGRLVSASLLPDVARERHYWAALEARSRRDPARALAEATSGLAMAQPVGNDELAWRLAAIGTIAAAALGHPAEADRLRTVVLSARQRLAQRWQIAFVGYDARQDLRALWQALDRP